jgi:hypothetical protein
MPFRASRRSERSRRGPAPDEAAGFLAGAVARSELAFGQEVKARLLQERAQGFPVEAQGSPSLHSMTLTSSFEGTQVAVRVGRGHDGRERCRGPFIGQDRYRGPCAEGDDQQGPDGLIEPASSFPQGPPGSTIILPAPGCKRARTGRPALPCRGADHSQPAGRRQWPHPTVGPADGSEPGLSAHFGAAMSAAAMPTCTMRGMSIPATPTYL